MKRRTKTSKGETQRPKRPCIPLENSIRRHQIESSPSGNIDFVCEKIEFNGSVQEVDTGLNTSWNPGLPWSTPPQITRKIDLSRRSPRQCNRLPRRPPAQRCQVLRSPSRPSNLSRGKNPDISPPGERGKSPASSDDGRDADEERCYRGSKEGGIHISWESEISCITWRWWRR